MNLMKSNILLISYNFPPITGPRSIRWVQFTKYLIRKGYKVDVLTINPEIGYGTYEKDSVGTIPRGVNVYRTYPGLIHKFSYRYLPPVRIKNQNLESSFKTLLRREVKKIYKKVVEPMLIPDKMIEYFPQGFRMIKKLIRENDYNLIVSSAMPFTDHILAYFTKKKIRIPWIADYGDPWVFNPTLTKIKWRYFINKWIESTLVKEMDYIIVTTNETKKGFIEYYPFFERKKIAVISQGYDPEEFEMIQPELGDKFRIVYTGIFYDDIREPYTFFDAINRLKDIELEVIMAGNILSHQIRAAEGKGLKEKVIFLGHQPHKRAIALQKGADLLLYLSNDSHYQLPGKIFEYFAASRPILVIQFDKEDIAVRLVKKYNRGIVVSNKSEKIAFAIKKIYELWQKGKLNKQFQLEPIEEYSWKSQAEKLGNVIKNVMFQTLWDQKRI